MTFPRHWICIAVIPALATFGCTPKNASAPATVSGKVTLDGEPIKGGSVQFITEAGVAYSSTISQKGFYAVNEMPEGNLVVTVETESIRPDKNAQKGKEAELRMKMSGGQKPPQGREVPTTQDNSANYVKIPEKYSNSKTSPLKIATKSGLQDYTIEMTK